jgi:hypothetical protein
MMNITDDADRTVADRAVTVNDTTQDRTFHGTNVLPDTDGEDVCDICGSANVVWRKCKLICLTCGTILKSCADL